MPGRDGTGPLGDGPVTGRGLGYCSNVDNCLYMGRGFCRRFYPIRGNLGRGFRNRYFTYGTCYTNSPITDEKKVLENQLVYLEKELELVRNRLRKIKEGDGV